MSILQKHAIIDIGSNSIRLVIIGVDQDFFSKELLNFKTVARLSNYIDENDQLSTKGVSILLDVLKRFRFIIEREKDVSIVDAFATAAMRKAKNRGAVLNCVFNETGLNVRLLSGMKEAYYGYFAVINSTYVEDGITIDIGGGSTEVTMFRGRRLIHSHSFSFGAVTLYQTFYKDNDPYAGDRLEAYIKKEFASLKWLCGNELPIIGIGGTARNLARIDQIQEHYPLVGLHQYTIPRERLNQLKEKLASMTLEERESMDGLSKDRADIILPASAVINLLVKLNRGERFMLSGEGLREGVFYEWVLKQRNEEYIPYVLNESLRQLRRNFNLDSRHTAYVKKLAFQIFDGILNLFKGNDSEKRIAWLLSHSADLAYLGEFINNESSSAQTFYLLTNMNINGISHRDRLAVALIASFKNRSNLSNFAKQFQKMATKEEMKLYETLGAVLRLAHDFDRTKLHVVDRLTVKQTKKKQLQLTAYYHDDAYFEEQAAQRHKKHLERALKTSVSIQFRNADK
ncbi:Ppx/GppA family phosphatase [Sporolactobacillus shoreicorticis]|uniref:Ppx/GppA family phosphatase n=1 Tax=Sporolactobacillus shoreicorticis TaxID=1923877 RepID=A0ABW5S436_9BACL|nr:Ppx/GppA phosphatase family protein [Sporolactobacillus shoreicorticis]MCO7127646.1 Ppx/GppA family phosphatase [Sporolactobacillus shoreicorticis]